VENGPGQNLEQISLRGSQSNRIATFEADQTGSDLGGHESVEIRSQFYSQGFLLLSVLDEHARRVVYPFSCRGVTPRPEALGSSAVVFPPQSVGTRSWAELNIPAWLPIRRAGAGGVFWLRSECSRDGRVIAVGLEVVIRLLWLPRSEIRSKS
jgi:hypothetical protein